MIQASDSTIELSVLSLKTNNLHFLTNSSVNQGLGHKTVKTGDNQLNRLQNIWSFSSR